MNMPIFTISLDFELHWGGFEKWPLNNYKDYFGRTRELIPTLLQAFVQSGVHTTWATVGLLLHRDRNALLGNLPEKKPSYDLEHLSAYHFMEHLGVGKDEQEDPFHYAQSLIQRILDTPGQEVGSHSFAHYYCNEPGQTPDQFKADAQAWNRAGKHFGIAARSLVFPRNQFNTDYLKVCRDVGIKIVRTNPVDWWWKIDSTEQESYWKRLNRGLDAYYGIGGKTSYSLESLEQHEGVWLLPASRLLRPFRPKELFLNTRKINRIKKEMTRAAELNEVYHLWWHPHNFGHFPKENIDGLVDILNHYHYLQHEYGMISLNMGEIADVLSNAKNS